MRARPGPAGEGIFAGPWPDRVCFLLALALVALIALTGGASRADVWGLLILRPVAVAIGCGALLLSGRVDWRSIKAPAWLLAGFAAAIAVQLIPLPPGVWLSLPGRAPLAEAAAAAGAAQPWRTVSLAPDLTLNSLVSLLVPAAVLVCAAALRPDQRRGLLWASLAVAALSALLGVLQIATGGFYAYAVTNYGRPVGLFANVNHHAAVLVAALPLAAAWAVSGRRGAPDPIRLAAGAMLAVLFLAVVLVSGSRSGLLLAPVGVGAAFLVLWDRPAGRLRMPLLTGALLVPASLLGLAWWAGRAGGLERLLVSGGSDARLDYLPITLRLLREHMPVGGGFGTFAALFRGAEPDAVLKLTYFNHAHNDLLELAITGGAPALAAAAAYVTWLAARGAAAFRRGPGADRALGRAGAASAALLLLASLADYPLRTPLAAALFALASLWAAAPFGRGRAPPGEDCAG